MGSAETNAADDVMRLADADPASVRALLAEFGMTLVEVPAGRDIPGSFWGDDEAGLIGNRLYARADTPLHSVLHESCHYLCMDSGRRASLHTDAGGDYDEENAVCYLQIVLAARIPGFGSVRCMADMDRWGYTFRLGSARAWFERDADDAVAALRARGIDVAPRGAATSDGAFRRRLP
jgi:hypothetical protein